MRLGRWFPARFSPTLICVLGSFGCQRTISADDCNRLLDHYVELLVVSDRPNTTAAELVKLKKDARARAQQDSAFVSCPKEVSRSQFECAMSATNADKLEQCML
jgi:hypothetical protein